MLGRDEWLYSVREEILEPDLEIIDPHHHLWRFEAPGLYEVEQLWADTGTGHNVTATVFVECGAEYKQSGPEALRPVGETTFVASQAALSEAVGPKAAKIKGIVGFANLLLGVGVAPVLAAHIEAGKGLFRGIRHAASWDASDEVRNGHSNPPEHLYLNPTFQQGFAQLAKFGLTFEAWCYHHHIPDITVLARAVPDVTIILDHFGGPLGIGPYKDKRAEIFEQWKQDIAELATCPNVVAKLGGLAMPINGFGWHKAEKPARSDDIVNAHGPYYRHTIDCFGPDRCMFESNFPVDRQSVSYPVLWNAFKKMAAGFSADEKTALFSGTAKRIYRLDV